MLNIFTDASITTTTYGETIGCSGAILQEDTSINNYHITRSSTNNIAEVTAIKLAVDMAIDLGLEEVNIWSDSQFAIFGLTKWIRSWMMNSQNHILKNSSGENVKNQHLFLIIIKTIIDNDLKVNFYHIKGHVKINDIKSIQHAISVFNKANNASINREDIYHALVMNDMVDKTSRNILSSLLYEDNIKLIRGVINPIISNKDMIRYYNLVTLGGNKI